MIVDAGGLALVQDLDEALYPGMPQSALKHTRDARALPLAELADAICAALEEPIRDAEHAAEADRSDDEPTLGVLTRITCPECGGTLWEHDEHGLARFKCHVGHAYSVESLEVAHGASLEGALWAGLRSLEERADLLRRMGRRIGREQEMEPRARAVERHVGVLRSLIGSVREDVEVPLAVGDRS